MAQNAPTTKLQYVLNVPLDPSDKRLLDRLVKSEKLPRTDVIRRLIRCAAAANATELKSVANG
jgi:hypothetical protein